MTQRVDINMLSPDELSRARQTISAELEFMHESCGSLKKAITLFEQARAAAEKMATCKIGQTSLVPLTTTLYMKGEVMEPSKTIVDIGTGYYVEMSSDRAVDFYKRKTTFVRGQLTTLNKVIEEKSATLQLLTEVLQKKIQAITAANPQPQQS
ncbi:Prefoldin, alpha subunit [Aphelenchoides besseyi]|nr:Prefoldin, alpha subunit [Aphelenchoides besseyi]KAI6236691.1 Prefoldin, alpha subunit [Aphelenchoides besseyi]